VFGSGVEDASQLLTANASLGGGFDDNIFAGSGIGTGRPNVALDRSGRYGFGSAGLAYALTTDRVGVTANARATSRYYPAANDSVLTTYGAGVGAGVQLVSRPRTQVSLNQALTYQPYNLLQVFPVEGGPLLENAGPADDDFTFGRSYTLSYRGGVALSQNVGRRASVNADYAYQRSRFSLRDRDFESHQAGLSYVHGLAEGLSLRLGYRFREGRYPSDGDVRRVRAHTADIGVDYNRTLAFSRRTTLAFSTGTSAFVRNERTTYRLVGRATLTHELGRTWTSSIGYNRNIAFVDTYVDTFDEPFVYDALSAGVEGLITQRLQFSAGARASLGRRGDIAGSDYDTYSASAGLNWAINRYMSAGATYFYYQYDLGTNPLPPNLLPRLERQGVRAQVTFWAPLFHRAGRP
jgi:hypothetical protein